MIKQRIRTNGTGLLLGIVLVFTLAACGSSPTVTFYALSPGSVTAAGTDSGLAVAIGPAEFPRALDRSQIVTRSSNTRVTVDEFHVWAAPLESEFLRVLGDNVATELNSDRVVVYPMEPQYKVDYRVILDVVQFDGALGGSVTLRVRWTITQPGKAPAAVGTFNNSQTVRGDDQDYDALVAAHSAAIGELSEVISARLRGLGKPAAKK